MPIQILVGLLDKGIGLFLFEGCFKPQEGFLSEYIV